MDHDDRHTTTHDGGAAGDSVNFTDWATREFSHLSEVSNSNPNARLRRHNLVAVTDRTDVGRAIALDFERRQGNGADISTLVLGHPAPRSATQQADPEGVTNHAARRSIIGGVPGAVAAALIIGVGVWLLTGGVAATAGAAIGGAIFGFYVSAVWSYVIGTGQSEAFQQGFVDPDATDAFIVAFHADDRSSIDEVRRAVAHSDQVRLVDVDAQGNVVG